MRAHLLPRSGAGMPAAALGALLLLLGLAARMSGHVALADSFTVTLYRHEGNASNCDAAKAVTPADASSLGLSTGPYTVDVTALSCYKLTDSAHAKSILL
eukprot:tig00021096_g18129.t1